MKKFRNYSLMMLLLAGGMTLASCSNEEDQNVVANAETTFTAEYPQLQSADGTRTTWDNGIAKWKKNDRLILFLDKVTNGFPLITDNDEYTTRNATFRFTSRQAAEEFHSALKTANTYSSETKSNGLVAAYHGPDGSYYDRDNDRIVANIGFGMHGGMHRMPMMRNDMCSDADLLLSKSVPGTSIKMSGNWLMFYRKTAILKIRLKYNSENEEFVRNFKATRGWLTTGDMNRSNGKLPTIDQPIYLENNFGGEAFISMAEENKGTLIKGKGSGIEFENDGRSGFNYFYDGAEDEFIYVNILPTTLNKNDSFSFALGDGKGNNIKKVIKLGNKLELKSNYIYTLNMNINGCIHKAGQE